ncbi:MAG: coenzyme F420-0:L-glutamate ligase [Candidatus Saccharimonadales bacterium]
MIVRTVKTDKVLAGQKNIFEVLDEFLPELSERSVIVVTSKIVALCENRVVPIGAKDKEELVKEQSDYFLPATLSKYGHHFTIANNTLAAVAGIDESNGDGNYVLWPKDSQKSANQIREYLKNRLNLKDLGVIISDSTCMPMRWGAIGQPLAYSGFEATKNYIGQPDLFGKPFKVSRSGIALGLAAAAVVAMGEGIEQTPIAVISDVDFVNFQDRDPTEEELKNFYIADYKDDLFGPFLESVKWQKGQRGTP